MAEKQIRILLVEDDSDDVYLLRETLSGSHLNFELDAANKLSAASERLEKKSYDVILLDLSLPDSRGLDTFSRVHLNAVNVPIVILSGMEDEHLSLEAVRKGAQDYLVKRQLDAQVLMHSILYSIERNRIRLEIENQSMVDELTSLYNRRGFMTLGSQYLQLARRRKVGLLFVFCDVDGLKRINDQFGHHEGDIALSRAAEVLKLTFRKSDIVARIGGDEFAVIAMEASQASTQLLIDRLRQNVSKENTKDSRYHLSISAGTTYAEPGTQPAIEEMMTRADAALYAEKRKKH